LAATIERSVPGAEVEQVAGGRGDFIVDVDGRRLWDKRRMGDEFPDEAELTARIAAG
jgi:predicted Rdx family selenoprotein